CGCAACTETLNYAAGQLLHVSAAKANPLTDPVSLRVTESHAHLGHIVECHQAPVGIICLFFNRSYQPSEADRRLLGIFASALGAEENRKRTDAELRASDERYRQIVQTANEGIWVTDEHDRITFANHRLAKKLGHTPEELLQRPVRDFIDPADLADHQHQVQLGRGGQASHFERRLRHHDGREFWTWVSGSPLFDDGDNYRGGFAMVTDGTARRPVRVQVSQGQKAAAI